MDPEKVSIVIVNYNLSAETEKCIRSLLEHVKYTDYEIVVVDNGSEEPVSPALAGLVAAWPHIKQIQVQANHGFGYGCNEGARHSSGTVLCFLNPDTEALDDFVAAMLRYMSTDESIAAAGPRINDPGYMDFSAGLQPRLWLELLGVFLIGRYVEALIISVLRAWHGGEGFEVGWVLGACLFVRRTQFDAVGGFDTDYFLYFEEVDLCRRLKERGARCMYYSGTGIVHTGSVTGRRDYRMFTQRFYGSKYLFLKKHYGSYRGVLLRGAFYCQVVAQMALWAVLYPVNRHKAHGKLAAFSSFLRPRRATEAGR